MIQLIGKLKSIFTPSGKKWNHALVTEIDFINYLKIRT